MNKTKELIIGADLCFCITRTLFMYCHCFYELCEPNLMLTFEIMSSQTHIFYDGTLAVPLVGPSVQFIPKFWRDLLYEVLNPYEFDKTMRAIQIAFVVMSFMWTLTPATCILQYTALSRFISFPRRREMMTNHRNDLTQWKRLLISFIPTVFCLILIAVSSSL